MNTWQTVSLGAICRPKQWPTLSKAKLKSEGFPVYGANGLIGYTDTYTHEIPTILVGCRGSCGSVHVTTTRSYANGNAMALDNLDQSRVDLAFLAHFLKHRGFGDVTTGTSQPQIIAQNISRVSIPLPPLSEQRRIAEILDGADALRTKRRAVLIGLDTLIQSIFLEMFGDPASNPRRWCRKTLKQTLTAPLRNGLSPSKTGRVSAEVLTLSAITGSAFDETARKTSTFLSHPPPDQAVASTDFLICRGNGNLRLVGKGQFPTRSMPEVTFPDTMIAARVSDQLIEPTFLQYVWNSNDVRRQIESLARTTNGTFKVNQRVLEGISFITPPLRLQQEFSRTANAVRDVKKRGAESLAELEILVRTLQHRAFSGELVM